MENNPQGIFMSFWLKWVLTTLKWSNSGVCVCVISINSVIFNAAAVQISEDTKPGSSH